MVEEHTDCDVRLASLRERRPVLSHRRVQIQESPRGEDMGTKGGCAFGTRKKQTDRIRRPRRAGIGAGRASPEVHDGLTAHGDAHRGADLAAFMEIALELLPDGVKFCLTRSLDVHCFSPYSLQGFGID